MKPLPALLCLLCFGLSALAEEVRFYVGTYTDTQLSQGVYTGTLDLQSGHLSPLTLASKATGPNYLALSPDQKFLYACTLTGHGSVAAFQVGDGGILKPLNDVPWDGEPVHLSVDATHRCVVAANYSDGSAVCFQLAPDGSIGRRTAFVRLTGSGPNPERQTHPYIHSIYLDPQNRFAYACDLGSDHVWLFDFDAQRGTLVLDKSGSGQVPPGSGPRHLAISRDGKFLYANGEMGLNVTVFARDTSTGALTPVQTVSSVPEGAPTDGLSTAEIFCHPSGKWLYVSIRDTLKMGRDRIAVYAIDGTGKLSRIQEAPAMVKVPRGFGIDPSGRWLIVGGQADNKIVVMKIDPATGLLSLTDQTAAVGEPVCVIFTDASK